MSVPQPSVQNVRARRIRQLKRGPSYAPADLVAPHHLEVAHARPRALERRREHRPSKRAPVSLWEGTRLGRNKQVSGASAQRDDGRVVFAQDTPVARVDVLDARVEPDGGKRVRRGHGDEGGYVWRGEERSADDAAHGVAHDDDLRVGRVSRENVCDGCRGICDLGIERRSVERRKVFVEFDW